ncbi:MAG: molybdopterin-dependent oxidoreductase, partial [Actinomycetota bacterium]
MAAGASGAAVALVASAIVHTLAPRVPFPPIAVAEAVVRWTPGAVATFFIDRLGHVALPLAVFATTAGFFALSMALGSLLPRPAAHLRGGSARVAALLGAPSYLLAILVMLPDSQTVGRVSYAAFLFPVFVVAVWVTGRRFDRLAGDGASRAVVVDRARRDVIRSLGTGGVGLLLGWSGIGRLFFRSPDPGRLPLRVHGVSPAALPTMAPGDSAFDSIPDLAPEVSSNEDFYVVDAEIIDPDIDADTWALSVGGLVDRPYLLTYDELLDLPAVERFVTMECISNQVGGHLISTAKWTGIPLRDLLLRAGVHDGAAEVVARAVGGYSD